VVSPSDGELRARVRSQRQAYRAHVNAEREQAGLVPYRWPLGPGLAVPGSFGYDPARDDGLEPETDDRY
jgi:hypothetical protein